MSTVVICGARRQQRERNQVITTHHIYTYCSIFNLKIGELRGSVTQKQQDWEPVNLKARDVGSQPIN